MVQSNSQDTLLRVLIADDHPAVREGLTAILTARVGVQVVAEACNGQEAVEMYGRFSPDVTLMDLRMPHVDGLTATRAILRDHPEARIIVLTAFEGEEENILRSGAKAVVLKDAPSQELLNTIYNQREEST